MQLLMPAHFVGFRVYSTKGTSINTLDKYQSKNRMQHSFANGRALSLCEKVVYFERKMLELPTRYEDSTWTKI